MQKLKGFGWMKLYDPERFYILQKERSNKAVAKRKGKKCPQIRDEVMISKLKDFSNKLGRTPSLYDIDSADRNDIPCATLYQRRFGSFNKAMEIVGLKPNEQSNNKDILVDIDYDCEQIILGSLLGDGNITKKGNVSSNFRINHCLQQKEYLLWKSSKIKNLIPRHRIIDKYNRIEMNTQCLPQLNEYYYLFYKNNIKKVTQEALDKLTALGIAIWYMDDGCIHKNGYVRLATHGFGLEGNKLIQKWFKEKYNILCTIYDCNVNSKTYTLDKTFFLYFPRSETVKLFQLIEKYKHPSLDYKFKFNPLTNRPKGQGLTHNEHQKIYRERHKEEISMRKKLAYQKAKILKLNLLQPISC